MSQVFWQYSGLLAYFFLLLWCCWLHGRKDMQRVNNPVSRLLSQRFCLGATGGRLTGPGWPEKWLFKDVHANHATLPRSSILIAISVLWRCWLGGRKGMWFVTKNWVSGWWGTSVVVCLERGANDYMWSSWCHGHLIISLSSKIQNGLPFWCRFTEVLLEPRPNWCSSIIVPDDPWLASFPSVFFLHFSRIEPVQYVAAVFYGPDALSRPASSSVKTLTEICTYLYAYVSSWRVLSLFLW